WLYRTSVILWRFPVCRIDGNSPDWLRRSSAPRPWRRGPCARTRKARMIEVTRIDDGDPLQFDVVVRAGAGESRHRTTMAQATWQQLTGGKHTPERCVEAAFCFLLDREPKESILARFDVTVIARYFPEFERELPRYL